MNEGEYWGEVVPTPACLKGLALPLSQFPWGAASQPCDALMPPSASRGHADRSWWHQGLLFALQWAMGSQGFFIPQPWPRSWRGVTAAAVCGGLEATGAVAVLRVTPSGDGQGKPLSSKGWS